MGNSNEGLTQAELYAKYNIVKMEVAITADELKSKVEKTKLSVADYVSRLKAQGMSKKDIQQLLVTDLKTGGPLFSELRSTFSIPFSSATSRISSTIANYEAAGGDPDITMVWIASFKNTCESCVPRHGVVKSYKEWASVGLPGNFGSYCNGYCQCRLFPKSYPGIDDMKRPNNRKQWAALMSGDSVTDPAKLPGSLVKSEELLIARQKKIIENIEKAKAEAKKIEAANVKLKADIAENQKALALQKSLQGKAENPLSTLEFTANTQIATPPILIPGNKNILGGGNVEIQTFKKFRKNIKDEPDFVLPGHLKDKKELSSGVIVKEADGRIWMIEPSGNFGGKGITFPKGRLEKGLTPAQNAVKEVYEETGLKVEVTGLVGDYERSTTYTRYYLGKRVGGDPAFAHWETGKVRLITPDEARKHLQSSVDHKILDDFLDGGQKQDLGGQLKAIPGTQKGSNPGGLYLDEKTGKQYYAKFYSNVDQARSEYAANELARSMGLGAPESQILEMIGPNGKKQFSIVSKWEDGLEKLNLQNHALLMDNAEEIAKHHLNAALVENWDVVGLEYDNLLRMPGGRIIVIDSGGSFRFRAQGLDKKYTDKPDAFDSLLDPGLNRQSSSVLQPVFDEYTKQNTEKLIAWLKEIDPNKVAEIFEKSGLPDWRGMGLNFLSRRNELIKRLEAIEKPKVTVAAALDIKDVAKNIRKSRLNGYAIPLDEDDIEDVYALFWEEIGRDGSRVLRSRLRLTSKGGEGIDNLLLQMLGPAPQQSFRKSGPHPLDEDIFYNSIVNAAKTVGYHSGDGKYNPATIATMNSHIDQLKNIAASGSDQAKAMAKQYLASIDDITGAMAVGGKPKMFTQYLYESPSKKAKDTEKVRGELKPRPSSLRVEGKSVKGGRATVTHDNTPSFMADSKNYEIDLPDGVVAKYVPWSYGEELYGLRGQMDLVLPGGASAENIQKMLDSISTLGIKNKIADPDYIELVYLHKHAYLRGDDLKSEYKKIWNSSMPVKEKVEKIKDYFEGSLGIPVRGNSAYNPLGERNVFGEGRLLWRRFDLNQAKIQEGMKGYKIYHSLTENRDMAGLVDNVLNAGGEFSATNERLRRGINKTGTMSQSADMRTGGSNYFFTRIKSNSSNSSSSIEWDIAELSRLDSISYGRDNYGEVSDLSVIRTRKFEPDGWKENAENSSNEVIFKHGIDIWHVKAIRTSDAEEREAVLEVFRKHKVFEINGKKIEDIVK